MFQQRVVDERQGPFIHEYQQFFNDSEMDVYTRAEKFRRSEKFSCPLGDAMPLAMANVLQLPIVLITSAQNMPIVTVTLQSIISETSIILAYTQRGAGHYDTLTERSPVTYPVATPRTKLKIQKSQLKLNARRMAKEASPVNATNIVIMSISLIIITINY